MLDAASSTNRSVSAPPPPPPPPQQPVVAQATQAPVPATQPANGGQVAANMVRAATDPASGRIDTRALADQVVSAARADPAAASAAYAAIEAEVTRVGGAGDLGRLSTDVQAAARASQAANNNDGTVFGTTFTGATVPAANRLIDAGQGQIAQGQALHTQGTGQIGQGQAMTARGTQLLTDNPILTVRWEATQSAWTRDAGLSGPLADRLRAGGIEVANWTNLPPAGSVGKNQGMTYQQANNVNGPLAEQMIGDRYRAEGYNVTTAPSSANSVQNGTRVVDVIAERPNADPRMNERIETESKVGYTTDSGRPAREATNDINRLADNRAARATGTTLETDGRTLTRTGEAAVEQGANLSRAGRALDVVGRVARPVGMAMDVVEVASAIRADGGVGENTGRTLSGLAGGAAGGWGGAAAGAAIGTAIFPGVGTVVGGVIGGIAGGLAGDSAGRGIFDTVRSWF